MPALAPLARYFLKLRRNIALEGDLLLARLELASLLAAPLEAVTDPAPLSERFALFSGPLLASNVYIRPGDCSGYLLEAPLAALAALVRRATFVQQIYCTIPNSAAARAFLDSLPQTLGPVVSTRVDGDLLVVYALSHYAAIELSDAVVRKANGPVETRRNLDRMLDALLGRSEEPGAVALAKSTLEVKSASAHLSHDIHYYKAKFFPRMARSMLNVAAEISGVPQPRVLDSFVGSGTTLLESAWLQWPSAGVDIDPLSVLVARTKLAALGFDSVGLSVALDAARETLDQGKRRNKGADTIQQIEFPAWLMKNRKMSPEIAARLSAELAALDPVLAAAEPPLLDLFRVLLSDALLRKVRLRFLGTGVGRFSLSFREAALADTFVRSLGRYAKVAAAGEWLRETLRIVPTQADVLAADARALPFAAGSFDIMLLSPPYLPASSGRESYARARALSLIALGMRDHQSVDELDGDTVGTMSGIEESSISLAPAESDVVNWLRNDPLRAIKAAPTARYFADMRRAFAEMRRVLRPGGCAVVVSGKVSTFYRFSTREPLYVVPVAEMLAESASGAGLEVLALHDVQLQKNNRNARPRSLDDYYETLIVLRRNEAGG